MKILLIIQEEKCTVLNCACQMVPDAAYLHTTVCHTRGSYQTIKSSETECHKTSSMF